MTPILLPVSEVRPHEEVSFPHVLAIMKEIVADGVVERPLIVARSCRTLLDGHHRYNALRMLEVDLLPCFLIDYDDASQVEVSGWRPGERVTSHTVRTAAATGMLLPPKTSRHVLKQEIPLMRLPISHLISARTTQPNFPDVHLGGAKHA